MAGLSDNGGTAQLSTRRIPSKGDGRPGSGGRWVCFYGYTDLGGRGADFFFFLMVDVTIHGKRKQNEGSKTVSDNGIGDAAIDLNAPFGKKKQKTF